MIELTITQFGCLVFFTGYVIGFMFGVIAYYGLNQ
jgi:hypothetical protein